MKKYKIKRNAHGKYRLFWRSWCSFFLWSQLRDHPMVPNPNVYVFDTHEEAIKCMSNEIEADFKRRCGNLWMDV